MAFSSDGKTVASGNRDKTIKLWEVIGGRVKALNITDSENNTKWDSLLYFGFLVAEAVDYESEARSQAFVSEIAFCSLHQARDMGNG